MNVVGTLNVIATVFPLMAARKKGHVVNMSSTMVSNNNFHIQIIRSNKMILISILTK